MIMIHIDSNFTETCSWESNEQVIIGSDIGLAD